MSFYRVSDLASCPLGATVTRARAARDAAHAPFLRFQCIDLDATPKGITSDDANEENYISAPVCFHASQSLFCASSVLVRLLQDVDIASDDSLQLTINEIPIDVPFLASHFELMLGCLAEPDKVERRLNSRSTSDIMILLQMADYFDMTDFTRIVVKAMERNSKKRLIPLQFEQNMESAIRFLPYKRSRCKKKDCGRLDHPQGRKEETTDHFGQYVPASLYIVLEVSVCMSCSQMKIKDT